MSERKMRERKMRERKIRGRRIPKREELLFLTVLAFPKASRMGLVARIAFESSENEKNEEEMRKMDTKGAR